MTVILDNYKNEVIAPGDRASKLAHQVSIDSFGNCQAVEIVPHQLNNFRGAVSFRWKRPVLAAMLSGEMMQSIETDGAGGKPQFFTLAGDPEVFKGLANDLIAMVADDFARSGRFPGVMSNIVDVKRITEANWPCFAALMEGLGKSLLFNHLVNITGETAVMKHSVTSFCDQGREEDLILNWGASCVGLTYKPFLISSSAIRPGMPIVGFHENGYRCNGGTFFTNLLLKKFGSVEGIKNNPDAMEFVRELTVPSIVYSNTIKRLVGWGNDGTPKQPVARITGIAHITGGGLWEKFGELLPDSIGAVLDGLPKPPKVLLQAQEWSQDYADLALDDHQAYSTFHGGCGMLLVCATDEDARKVSAFAKQDGLNSKLVGRTITRRKSYKIQLRSRFRESEKVLCG